MGAARPSGAGGQRPVPSLRSETRPGSAPWQGALRCGRWAPGGRWQSPRSQATPTLVVKRAGGPIPASAAPWLRASRVGGWARRGDREPGACLHWPRPRPEQTLRAGDAWARPCPRPSGPPHCIQHLPTRVCLLWDGPGKVVKRDPARGDVHPQDQRGIRGGLTKGPPWPWPPPGSPAPAQHIKPQICGGACRQESWRDWLWPGDSLAAGLQG